MKHLLFLLLLLPSYTEAQVNLVLNPSFEQYSHCSTDLNQIEVANYLARDYKSRAAGNSPSTEKYLNAFWVYSDHKKHRYLWRQGDLQ